jgi:CopG family nickel-responsive transcriptional regulator
MKTGPPRKGVSRFGVSLETDLLARFDGLIDRIGYASRSEAIRDLIRARLVEDQAATPGIEVVGVLGLVYDHERREITETLTHIQHKHLGAVVSATHIHLDHHNCLEVIILRGEASLLRTIADELRSIRSVKHGDLILTTTGHNIP